MDRRAAIRLGVLAALGPIVTAPFAAAQSADGRVPETLVAFVRYVLPGDDQTPAADLQPMAVEIAEIISENPALVTLRNNVMVWLDGSSRGAFWSMPAQDQDAIMNWMEQAGTASWQGFFFAFVRRVAIELHYSTPDAVAGFPLNAAPQPDGYLPPWS